LHETLADLFSQPRDALEVMKLREICGLLEESHGSCEDVANVVEASS
jgi:uncharacterized protein Yka (UPF0111/DUF47 family)